MATIGEQLRAAREAKGLTLNDAHRHTKIHARILQAMEDDRTGEVLEPAYARGFLKKYATFLQLNPEPLVATYVRASAPHPTSPSDAGPGGPSYRWVGPAAIVLTAVIGVAFLIALSRDLYRTVAATSPAVTTQSSSGTGYRPVPGTGEGEAAPKLLVPKSQPLRVAIRAAQDCWMQVKSDGTVLFQNVLRSGQEEVWTATEGLELWVGNAAALTLSLNGRPLEPLGRGVIKGIRITRYGLQHPKGSR